MKKTLAILLIFIGSWACKQTPKSENEKVDKQKFAINAIEKWMLENSEYPSYKPIQFGDLNPRYERTPRSIQLEGLIESELAQHPQGSEKLDSLRNLQTKNMGNLLGYILLHKYETTSNAGEKKVNESLFFLDTALRIATVLNPEAFDQILIERHVFRLDSIE